MDANMETGRKDSPLFSKIEKEADCLYFQRALKMLGRHEDELFKLDPYRTLLLKARLLVSSYQWQPAEETLAACLPFCAAEKQKASRDLWEIRLLVCQNRLAEARSAFEKSFSDPEHFTYEIWLSESLISFEEGRLQEALSACRRGRSLLEKQDPENRRLIDFLVLEADILSCRSDPACYGLYRQALEKSGRIPANWRDLRKALIFNNMADAAEQEEDWQKAAGYYSSASELILSVSDEEIFDLDGYRLEILLSQANFCSLTEKYEQSEAIIREAEALSALDPKSYSALYWNSRINYLKGLNALYQNRPEAFSLLVQAYEEQKEFLDRNKAGSREYMARAAYYSAWSLNDAQKESLPKGFQEKLYQEALAEFQKIEEKEPRFFLHSIADIYNELGNIQRKSAPQEAAESYEKSVEAFARMKDYGLEDAFSRQSLLVAAINRLSLGIPFENQDPEKAEAFAGAAARTILKIAEDREEEKEAASLIERLRKLSLQDQASGRIMEQMLARHDITLN